MSSVLGDFHGKDRNWATGGDVSGNVGDLERFMCVLYRESRRCTFIYRDGGSDATEDIQFHVMEALRYDDVECPQRVANA